ncbi:MAG TPA: hypothetical protein VHB48_06290 [Chitinophagaceae bacterium]|nr:hypothetical protein [Chitinophagaceae bacterium]
MGKTPLSSVALRIWEKTGSKNINLGDIPARYSPQIDYENVLEPHIDTLNISVTVVWKNGGYFCQSKVIRKPFRNFEVSTKYYRPDMKEFDPTQNNASEFLRSSR